MSAQPAPLFVYIWRFGYYDGEYACVVAPTVEAARKELFEKYGSGSRKLDPKRPKGRFVNEHSPTPIPLTEGMIFYLDYGTG